MTRSRGQLVLLAAAAIAVALVPLSFAYLQLGYHGDVRATAGDDVSIDDTERSLRRALTDASATIPDGYSWGERNAAVTAVRDRLRPTLATLNTSRLDSGSVVGVSYNHSRATTVVTEDCPSGPSRQFGRCVADRGVVVQERIDRTHVLAVAVDVQVTTTSGEWRAIVVSHPSGIDREPNE